MEGPSSTRPEIQSISAITLATHNMARAVRFYLGLGFRLRYGGEDADFTSFGVGSGYLNLVAAAPDRRWAWWGRVVLYVSDVDALYARALGLGFRPQGKRFEPHRHHISHRRCRPGCGIRRSGSGTKVRGCGASPVRRPLAGPPGGAAVHPHRKGL